MDYRDLIDTMRNGDPLDIVVQAYWMADAIETLLKERDAAVEDMKGICSFCAHKKTCQFGNHLRDICVNGSRWRWRGPREGGGIQRVN